VSSVCHFCDADRFQTTASAHSEKRHGVICHKMRRSGTLTGFVSLHPNSRH